MDARTRKALGSAGLLVYLGLYAAGAASLGAMVAPWLPPWAALLYYAIAGIIWIVPLKPLLAWMNRPD